MVRSKLKLSVATIFPIVAGGLILWQQIRVNRLETDNAALREQLQQTMQKTDAIQHLAEQLKAETDSRAIDTAELMRLRAQAASLRQTQQENARLKDERERLI